jgi:holo-[acyl-carrier protein] synthase
VIYGIGTDLIRIQRLRDSVERFGDRFARRILMPEEWSLYPERRDKARFLAMRFAGKEAVSKALGTGFAHGIWVRDIGIVHDAWGKPEVLFSARGARRCAELGVGHCLVSLADEGGFALAYALATTRGSHSQG